MDWTDRKLIIEAITHLFKSVQTDFSAKLREQDNKKDSNTKELSDLKAQILALNVEIEELKQSMKKSRTVSLVCLIMFHPKQVSSKDRGRRANLRKK